MHALIRELAQIKGAPERTLKLCDRFMSGSDVTTLDEQRARRFWDAGSGGAVVRRRRVQHRCAGAGAGMQLRRCGGRRRRSLKENRRIASENCSEAHLQSGARGDCRAGGGAQFSGANWASCAKMNCPPLNQVFVVPEAMDAVGAQCQRPRARASRS